MAEPYNHCRHTAARRHGRSRREIRPRSMTVDIHSHAGVQAAADLARPHVPSDPRGKLLTEETRFLTRKQDTDRTPNLIDLGLRMRDFEATGLDAQVVSPAPGLCHQDLRLGTVDFRRRRNAGSRESATLGG